MMKRALIFLSFLTPSFLGAQAFLEPFAPVTPQVMALGKAGIASTGGYNALFFNPANLSLSNEGFTIATQANLFLSPSFIRNLLQEAFSQPGNLMSKILNQGNGGEQISLGVGFVGQNIGVGVVVDQKSYVHDLSSFILSNPVILDITYAFIVGYSLPIDLQITTLRVGALVRSLYKIYKDVSVDDFLTGSPFNFDVEVDSGFGLGCDLGVQSNFGPFQVGVALRDIGNLPLFLSKKNPLLASFSPWAPFITSESSDQSYAFPMTFAAGASYRFAIDLYQDQVGFLFLLDFQIPCQPLKKEFLASVISWIHAGLEVQILDCLFVRAGYNQNYLTTGMGIKVSFLEFNWAIFTEEIDNPLGTVKRSGMSAGVIVKI